MVWGVKGPGQVEGREAGKPGRREAGIPGSPDPGKPGSPEARIPGSREAESRPWLPWGRGRTQRLGSPEAGKPEAGKWEARMPGCREAGKPKPDPGFQGAGRDFKGIPECHRVGRSFETTVGCPARENNPTRSVWCLPLPGDSPEFPIGTPMEHYVPLVFCK